MLLYYEPKNHYKSVAPDVFVVFGIEKKRRRTYLLWEEGKGPDFVLEFVSKSTYRTDLAGKKDLYASVFGVKEYYLYDPDGLYLQPPLQGYHLVDGVYLPIQTTKEYRFPSFVLGLELGERALELGLYNPQTKSWLLKPAEEAEARIQAEAKAQREFQARQRETEARKQAEAKAQKEFQARQQEAEARKQAEVRMQEAEAELARLRAELEQLRN